MSGPDNSVKNPSTQARQAIGLRDRQCDCGLGILHAGHGAKTGLETRPLGLPYMRGSPYISEREDGWESLDSSFVCSIPVYREAITAWSQRRLARG